MADRQTAHEHTYDVDPGFVVPDLGDLTPDGGHLARTAISLESVYFDTEEHDLLRHGVTLRSRSGDSDTGWELALPAGIIDKSRSELRLPASGPDIPAELLTLTAGLRRGADLRSLATIRTHRGIQRITDAEGSVLIEVADDQLHSAESTPDGAVLQEWRAIDTEVGVVADGVEKKLGKRLDKRFRESGAVEAARRNEFALALNSHAPVTTPPVVDATAGGVVVRYLQAQDDDLIAGDLALRQGAGAIHSTRVATRRLRSTLRIFGHLFDADRSAQFDTELSWYADLLGQVRDPEVQRERMQMLLAELPDELILGAVAARIEEELRSQQLQAQRELTAAMNSQRYFDLLVESRRWATSPPFTDAANAKPATLAHFTDKAAKKLSRHLHAGLSADDDTELHKARKAGKRARYAAELITPVLGKSAQRQVSRYEKLQDTLGDHQDGVVSCELLKRLALGTVGKRTQNGFTYGLLYARELERATSSRRKATRLYAKLQS